MHEVLRQNMGGGPVQVLRRVEAQVVGQNLQQVRAALDDVVLKKLDAVDTHHGEERGSAVFRSPTFRT